MEMLDVKSMLTDKDHKEIRNRIQVFLENIQCSTPSLKKPVLSRSSNKGIFFGYMFEKDKSYIIYKEFVYDKNNNVVDTKYNCIG